MQRVTRATAAAVLPSAPASPGPPGFFTGGDPVANLPATVPGYEWYNGVQEELAAAILHSGQALSGADLTQLRKHISRVAGGGYRSVAASVTLTVDDAGVVDIAAAAGNVSLTLPLANSAGGRPIEFVFVRRSAANNSCDVVAAGTDGIEGATSWSIPPGGRVTLRSDGTGIWRLVGGAEGAGSIIAVTSNISISASDAGLILADATAGNITITLPGANTLRGQSIPFVFVRTDATANTVTISRAGANLIEGQATLLLAVGERLELVGDGSTNWRTRSRSGPLGRMQVFTAGGTFTVPQGVYRVKATVTGGGGGGGGTNTSGGAGGGSAGQSAIGWYNVTPNQAITVTVGTAGAAGASGAGNGGNGGTSSFGAFATAPGGVGGNGASGAGGISASAATGGQMNIWGGDGGEGTSSTSSGAAGGIGGASIYGGGGRPGATAGGGGVAGRAPGSGGGGAFAAGGAASPGGAGAPGIVVVEW